MVGLIPIRQEARKEMQTATESWIDFRRMMVQVSEEKRRFPRLEFHCPARLHGINGTGAVACVTDISMGGVFVEIAKHCRLEKGQILYLHMAFPTEPEAVEVKARVSHVRDRGVGMMFVRLTPRNRKIIRFCFDTFKDTLPLV
jgi:hypothetical protein